MKPARSFWITVLSVSLLFGALALVQAVPQLQSQGISLWRSKWTLLLGLFALSIPASGLAIWGLVRGRFDSLLVRADLASFSGLARAAAILSLLLALTAFWYARLNLFAVIVPQLIPALWLFLWTSILASAALKLSWRHSWTTSFFVVVLTQAVLFRVWAILGDVTSFPFTLEYSETSRFYYASLWFSKSIYGMDVPLSPWHPSRYLLQSIPFLIPNLPLWAHRLWQALLWIILTGAASLLLAHRLNFPRKGLTALVAMWAFVYFLQGAVYYHLQVCVIIILLGVSPKRPWQSLIAVVAASLWAGISRLNWIPVPAMLATALYLLEEPVSKAANFQRYLSRPVLWTVNGLAAALASQALYILWSGNGGNANDFGSSLTSDLIWSRLLPNVTYPPGVLPAILLVSLPLLIALAYFLRGKRANWNFVRPLGLFAMLAVLFLGGLVVSTKIGGGADIHNMDAFMILLSIVVASFFAGRVRGEIDGGTWGNLPLWPLALAILIPAGFALQSFGPRPVYNFPRAEKELTTLQGMLSNAAATGGEVLFISERHLVTFHMVEGVTLVPEYEVTILMEEAMSGDQTSLQQFYDDLAAHRFAVIVTRKQRVVKKIGEPFSEENNIWTEAISRPLLCYYERSVTFESSNTLILVPSQTTEDCP